MTDITWVFLYLGIYVVGGALSFPLIFKQLFRMARKKKYQLSDKDFAEYFKSRERLKDLTFDSMMVTACWPFIALILPVVVVALFVKNYVVIPWVQVQIDPSLKELKSTEKKLWKS